MTSFSADVDRDRSCGCPPGGGGRAVNVEPDLSEVFRGFRQRIDGIRAAGGPGSPYSAGPADLALTVVAEALAIAEAVSRIAVDSTSAETGHCGSPAIYAGIDSRFVEHRARALRSALHGVDDYVWWGGLAASTG